MGFPAPAIARPMWSSMKFKATGAARARCPNYDFSGNSRRRRRGSSKNSYWRLSAKSDILIQTMLEFLRDKKFFSKMTEDEWGTCWNSRFISRGALLRNQNRLFKRDARETNTGRIHLPLTSRLPAFYGQLSDKPTTALPRLGLGGGSWNVLNIEGAKIQHSKNEYHCAGRPPSALTEGRACRRGTCLRKLKTGII